MDDLTEKVLLSHYIEHRTVRQISAAHGVAVSRAREIIVESWADDKKSPLGVEPGFAKELDIAYDPVKTVWYKKGKE